MNQVRLISLISINFILITHLVAPIVCGKKEGHKIIITNERKCEEKEKKYVPVPIPVPTYHHRHGKSYGGPYGM